MFKTYSERELRDRINDILSIENHEYLHQGQLIVMFRLAEKELPQRFVKAWNL